LITVCRVLGKAVALEKARFEKIKYCFLLRNRKLVVLNSKVHIVLYSYV
jgi:hypothetical protein